MLKLNQAIFTILTMTSSLVFASTMQASNLGCQKPTWSVGAQALYLRPSFGGNGLGYTSFSNYGNDIPGNLVNVNGAPNHMSNINPDWNWGLRLEAAYAVDSNDFNLNWSHFNENTHGYLPSGTLFAGSAGGLYAGYLKVAPTWNAVNLEVGHRLNCNTINSLRLHAGLAYANIQTKFTNYPQLLLNSSPLFITTDSISYNGFGPRFGGDFDYAIGYGFGVYAKAAGSLLVGTAKQSVKGYQNFVFNNSTYPYTTGNYTQSHNGVVVPELEAKLGVTYDYQLSQGSLGFDLGYLWVTYLNAIVSQVGADVYSSAISASTTTNFDLNGLYFGIKWTGNV